ncbi:MAG: hypothetical protein HGA96_05445 [Desulfobulbaceae bacterium]|nr:hypothetical protein [Desulfobulbaceae bacterium]
MDTEDDKEFTLDESAQQLYQQLDGIDDTLRVDLSLRLESELMEFLQQEEQKRDNCRVLIAQAACLFVGILAETQSVDFNQENNPNVRAFLSVLKKLAPAIGRDSLISCRYRGQQAIEENAAPPSANPEAYDYELAIGDILLDYQVAGKVEQREPVKGRALCAKLLRAFTVLSGMRIFNFSIEVKGGEGEENSGHYEKALRALVRYYNSKNAADDFWVRDEYGLPNINLTLLAATNNIRPDSLQKLVETIKARMFGPDPDPELRLYTTVYDVILASKRCQQQLPKMAIEVNSMHQLMRDSRINVRRTAEAVQVSRLVLAQYGSDPKKASELISSISKDGYRNLQSKAMGKRLAQATEFMEMAEGCENQESLQNEALQNIEQGLQNIPDEVYDELRIEGEQVSSVDAQGRQTSWSLHQKVFELVSYFKQRARTKKKVRDINNQEVHFDAVDYAVIAKNCRVTEGEAERLVALLKECFSATGRFRRSSFEKNIPEFLQYDENVFEFLWYYMKELGLKGDRIAFLNAIQLLVSQLKKPETALNILLTDIFSPDSAGRFSDRNGLILAIILLRTYNQEENSNIELTPEEVLCVWAGLNKEMVKVGREFFRHNQEPVVLKVKRLTELLLQISVQKAHQEEQMRMRFLISLMREVVVFCSLIGGRISQSTVKGVVREFGNPASAFYKKIDDKSHISQGLKLLQVAARGLKRFNDPHSAGLLENISYREKEFVELHDNPTHRIIVKKIMARVGKPDS